MKKESIDFTRLEVVTKENIHKLRAGMEITYCMERVMPDGSNEWYSRSIDDFDIKIGWFGTGMHNEGLNFLSGLVYIQKTYEYTPVFQDQNVKVIDSQLILIQSQPKITIKREDF